MKKSVFLEDRDSIWLKGNLHSHSTFSDGAWTPEQLKEQYKSHGYDFLAVTDHDIYADTRHLSDNSFTMLQGYELWGRARTNDGLNNHINFLWAGEIEGIVHGEMQSLKKRTGKASMERCYEMRKKGAYVILNHPHWSHMPSSDVEAENPYHAVEVINYGSDFIGMGDSKAFWSELLYRGVRLWGGGADDNHNKHVRIESGFYGDSFGGFTVVKASDRSDTAIIEALKAGSFYTSTGPSIYEFYIEEGMVHVKCSPCTRILVLAEFVQAQGETGKALTEYSCQLRGTERLVRVECMDEEGRVAYSNPIWLDDKV